MTRKACFFFILGFLSQFGLAGLSSLSSEDCKSALSSAADQSGDMMMQDLEYMMSLSDGDELYLMQQFKNYFELGYWDVLCYYIRNPEKMYEETPNYVY